MRDKDRESGAVSGRLVAEATKGRPGLPRYLAYALPREGKDNQAFIVQLSDGFDLYDVPLGSPESFLKYEGTVLFAGAFERLVDSSDPDSGLTCIAPDELDLREREFWTAFDRDIVVVLLVPPLEMDWTHVWGPRPRHDLFKRVLSRFGIKWEPHGIPYPHVRSAVPEFRDYVDRWGSGYVSYQLPTEPGFATAIAIGGEAVFGVAVCARVFLLPAVFPQSRDQAVKMAVAALEGAIAYRQRVSKEMPEWVEGFRFAREQELRGQADEIRQQLASLDQQIGSYHTLKGALCHRSDPLVEVVAHVLREWLGIVLAIDDKRIEDAALKDEAGNILAVFEIKGVNENFKREHVNQVDSHRERLGLPRETPGILIMNTMMSADSLPGKDKPPHPDIIAKAVADNVLLVRTLDVLRYADCVEKGILTKEGFRAALLGEPGWLKVENDAAEVVNVKE